jgi:hypothetical protein
MSTIVKAIVTATMFVATVANAEINLDCTVKSMASAPEPTTFKFMINPASNTGSMGNAVMKLTTTGSTYTLTSIVNKATISRSDLSIRLSFLGESPTVGTCEIAESKNKI